MPIHSTSVGPYVTGRDPDGKHWGGFLYGCDLSKPGSAGAREITRQIDDRLIAELRDEQGMPRVIALLEEIRDRLAGVRPTIHVPTADECRRFGGKGVR